MGIDLHLSSVIAASTLVPVARSRGDDRRHPRVKTGKQPYDQCCASCRRDAGDGAFVNGVPAVEDTSMTYRQMTDQVPGHSGAVDARMPDVSTLRKAGEDAVANNTRGKRHTD